MNAMVQSQFGELPAMPGFNVSNDLIDDRAALEAAWERDGYWFFKGLLDKDAVARVRAEYIEVLESLGVVEPGCTDEAIYNGAPLDNYPITQRGDPARDPLLARAPRDRFVVEPKVKAVFEKIFGGEVFWVPNTEYHAVPPQPDQGGSRFNGVHCDGANNKGLPLKVCWMPLVTITEAIGGLALTEGLHTPRLNDFPRPPTGVKLSDVPDDAWRRTTYEPGDLLVFGLESPHSGLANRSEKHFRLSMDIRGMLKSDNVPTIGAVAAIDRNAIAVDDNDGSRHVFRIDDDTFCRVYRNPGTGMPLERDEIPELVKVGAQVYVAAHHGTAMFIRPQH